MKLEDQCVSLELAKKLKELGVKQDSLFHWVKDFSNEFEIVNENEVLHILENYSAFTAAELLEILPIINGVPVELIKGSDLINGTYYCCRYFGIDENILHAEDKNPSNACAKLLIYLIENGLIKNEVP